MTRKVQRIMRFGWESNRFFQCLEHFAAFVAFCGQTLSNGWKIQVPAIVWNGLTDFRNGNTLYQMQSFKQTIFLCCALFVTTVCAQEPPIGALDPGKAQRTTAPENLQGAGKNFGEGWRYDSSGNWQGTKENSGKGWRTDDQGNLQGTGDNFGSGWRKDGSKNWVGTGKNAGSGWRMDDQGNLQGTGDNFGSGWRKDGLGNWVGTGKNFGKTWRVE